MRRLHFLFMICLLCVCSFAGGKRVLFIGDSITDGNWGNNNKGAASSQRNHWDLNHIYGHGYMYLCAVYYQSKFPNENYMFFNRGISGNTLSDLEKRWNEDVIQLNPDILSVLIGTNDVAVAMKDEGYFDLMDWECRYRALLTTARKNNPRLKIVLGAPFVAKTGKMAASTDFEKRDSLIHCCADVVKQIAMDFNAVYLPYDSLFDDLCAEKNLQVSGIYWICDGIHPTPAGHARMAELWLKETSQLFK